MYKPMPAYKKVLCIFCGIVIGFGFLAIDFVGRENAVYILTSMALAIVWFLYQVFIVMPKLSK